MSAAASRQKRLAYFAWLAVCLIWGTTYLGIRICLETIPPGLMVGLRWITAGSLLAAYLAARGERLPPPARWPSLVWLGFLLLTLGNGGVVWAEQWVPSGLTAVLVASSPFWMAAAEALRGDGERLRLRVGLGLLVGFSGILLLVWPDMMSGGVGGRGFLAGVISLQIASIAWALGSSYSRRYAREENVLSMTAAQMLAGGFITLLLGLLHGELGALHFSTRSALALGYLSTVGAIGGFVAYTYALRHLPISLVSLYAYINPIIAVALGVTLMAEPLTSRMAAAAGLVLAGVAIVRSRSGESETRTDAPDRSPPVAPEQCVS